MVVSFVFGMVLLLLQLSPVQQRVADHFTSRFNTHFEGNISIGSVRGTLPLELELREVVLTLHESPENADPENGIAPPDTLLQAGQLYLRIDLQRSLFQRLTISSIRIEDPEVKLAFEPEQSPSLLRAFRPRQAAEALEESEPDPETEPDLRQPLLGSDLPRIYLQDLSLKGGSIRFSGLHHTGIDTAAVRLPDSFSAENLLLSLSLELFEDQRLLVFREMRFTSDVLPFGELLFRGQLYTDERFLEFNRITLQTPESLLRFNLVFDGVNAAQPDLGEQLRAATVQFRVDDSRFYSDEFQPLFPMLPVLGKPLEISLLANGTLESVEVPRFDLLFGESAFRLYGDLANLDGDLSYTAIVDFLNIKSSDLDLFLPDERHFALRELGLFTLRGEVSGSLAEAELNLSAESATAGRAALRSSIRWVETPAFDADLRLQNLNFASLPSLNMGSSSLNATVSGAGTGATLAEAKGQLEAVVSQSRLLDFKIDDARLTLALTDGFLEPDFTLRQQEGGELSLTGWLDLISEETVLSLEGRLLEFRPELAWLGEGVLPGLINSELSLQLRGSDPDSFLGEAFLSLQNSAYGDEQLDEFAFFVTLENAESPAEADIQTPSHRILRIGGTMLEAEITGSLIPSELIAVTEYWYQQMDRLITERSLYQLSGAVPVTGRQLQQRAQRIPAQDLDIRMRLDDLTLLHMLFPSVPKINTLSNLDATVTADGSEVRFRSSFTADFIDAEAVQAENVVTRLNFSIRPEAEFGFFSGLLQLDADVINIRETQQIREISLVLDMYDEAFVLQRLQLITGDDITLGAMASAVFTNRDVDIRLMDFFVGDEGYTWSNIRQTPIRIFDGGQIFVDQLEFGNQEERFMIDGTFSENPEDVVSYFISGLELERISGLINGRVNFSGVLDGSFETRTIRTDPRFKGGIGVDQLRLNDRLVGDITFNSTFNPLLERFDTILTIQAQQQNLTEEESGGPFLTDELVMKDVIVEGYFNTLAAARETALYASFDVRLNEIDLWILPLIVSNVFEEVEGRAQGNGVFEWGEAGMYFDSRFELMDVELVPVFLMTRLLLNGNIDFSSERGVEIDNVRVRDTRNGRGTLSGRVDLNNFAGPTLFDLQLQMSNLTFLNNSTGPDVPFFGRGQGTGIVRLSGSSDEPFISTPQPIVMSGNSIISIPITTDQSVEGGTRFIQFVDEFDFSQLFLPPDPQNGRNNQNGREVNLTFMEKFGLDLQFVANDNMTVRLIFDEVTSEILSARGTGRIRLGLQDEVFQVFGSFDVASGDYLFVGGDIFSRRFSLREGGTITWDGDPINANIDVSASYRARPNINALRPGATIDDAPVRIPVDLVLVITGTLDSIENDFFFEFPTGTDITQIAAIQAALDNEDTKLLQATSILLSGNFVPLDSELNSVFANQFGAQGLSMLLSSQISSLLNSNISNLDIDLNLTGFDEADLGIALRLFDDRLTVRREGTVTGPDSHWGDFDVTYRINRYFSIEAFLRRESLLPSAISVGRDQNDEVYGIGLEARVQFNTWGELRDRVWGSVRRLFGRSRSDTSTAGSGEREDQRISLIPAAATENRQTDSLQPGMPEYPETGPSE